MNDHPVLEQVALGYSPVIDPKRNVAATRLTLFPLKPDAAPPAADLLTALAEVWPEPGAPVCLNIAGEALLRGVLEGAPQTNMWIEVPAFLAADAAYAPSLLELHGRGLTLLLSGRPTRPVPREVLPCFKHSVIDVHEERRSDGDGDCIPRSITHMQSGVRTLGELEAAFKRGAVGVIGWPLDDAMERQGAKGGAQADYTTIVRLIQQVDKELPAQQLEETIKHDPALAFKLMRYINSPAFGLAVEISSFRHAIMVLGYQRLKRWLALLLVSASKDQDMRPVMYAAVRRGLLMEELVRGNEDASMGSKMFIYGVFSLLDKMMRQPFAELLKSIPVPQSVFDALANDSGPYHPYLELVRAIEGESLLDMRAAAERLMLGLAHVNRATLRALTAAMQLD